MQGETHDALGATHTWAVFTVVALIQSHAKEELPERWMSLQILPSTWNASDCLLNCSSKRKHWQESVIKMEAKGAAVTFWGLLFPINPSPVQLKRPAGASGLQPHQLPESQFGEGWLKQSNLSTSKHCQKKKKKKILNPNSSVSTPV